MNDREVIVLEDMRDRVDWLLGVTNPICMLTWCKTVESFRRALEANPAPAAVVLDHDLGPDSLSGPDANGETGLHAARAIPAHAPYPVLVWSINQYRADNMVYELRSKGVSALRVPFMTDNKWAIQKFVVHAVAPDTCDLPTSTPAKEPTE